MTIKAIIPAAGYGTRMLPFAKSVPKEMLPLVNKPVIQYVVEEALEAGIEEILIVLSEGKEAIKEHFSSNKKLEKLFADRSLPPELAALKKISNTAKIEYIYQSQPRGLGDAVKIAADFAGDSPVAILLGDTVMETPVTKMLVDKYLENGNCSSIALEKVPPEKISRYGIAGGTEIGENCWKLDALVEKPSIADAPGDLAVAARYLLNPGIFRELSESKPGLNGEIQLTDAIGRLLKKETVFGYKISGRRFDAGTPAGFIMTNVELGLQNPEYAEILKEKLRKILDRTEKTTNQTN